MVIKLHVSTIVAASLNISFIHECLSEGTVCGEHAEVLSLDTECFMRAGIFNQ